MGFIIYTDIETNLGNTTEMYCRIESFTFNKLTADLGFQITYWINRDACIKSSRLYLDQEVKNQKGIISNKIISYEMGDNGKDIQLEQFLVVKVSKKEEITIPIYDVIKKNKEIPYISFDSDGNEITLYRNVELDEEIIIGSNIEIKEVIDYSLLKDIYGFMYGKLCEYLCEWFSKERIKII